MAIETSIAVAGAGLLVVLGVALVVWRSRRRRPEGAWRAMLEFGSGPLAGQSIELAQGETAIGSVAGNQVLLADPAVSRRHARVVLRGKRCEVNDLGSTNGVYVNGRRRRRQALASGDVLRIGNSELVFRIV